MLEVVYLSHQVDYLGEIGAFNDGFCEVRALLSGWLIVQSAVLGLFSKIGLGAKVLQFADHLFSSHPTRTVVFLILTGLVLLDDLVVLLRDLVDLSLQPGSP